MSSSSWRTILALALCVACFVGLRVFRSEAEPAPVPSQKDIQELQGVPVELGRVERVPVQRTLRVFGVAQGAEQAEVVCTSPNLLRKLHVRIGQRVRAGAVLATMRDTPVSPLAFPYKPLSIKNATLQADLARYEELRAKGAINEVDFQHARAQADAAHADLEAARAARDVTSPISGIVTRIDFREGDMVPNDRPLLQVARIDDMVADFMVESGDLALIAEGQPVALLSAALPGRPFAGIVTERALGASPVQRQYRVRVEVTNPDLALLPGFPVEGTISVGSPDPLLSVPVEALGAHGDHVGVWVASPQGALFVPVVSGISDGRRSAIVEGALTEGQSVVTLGREHLERDGQALLVVE